MAQEARIFKLEDVKKWLKARKSVNKSHVNEVVQATITGEGNPYEVKDKAGNLVIVDSGRPLTKIIYNTNIISDVSVRFHKPKLVEAMKLEESGDAEGASELYKQFMNKVVCTVSVWDNSRTKFSHNQQVRGVITLITEEDGAQGELLRLEKVSAVKAIETKAASIDDILGLEGESDEAPAGNIEDLIKG